MAKVSKFNTISYEVLAEKKYAESGFDEEDIELLNFSVLTPEQMAKEYPGANAMASIRIPYFDLDGNPAVIHKSVGTQFCRYRYLSPVKTPEGKILQKYTQIPHSPPLAYFPTNIDWKDAMKNVSVPICITEGEFKAAAACKYSLATIGLGGVWNFRSSSHGWEMLPEMKRIDWKMRKVYICFDSDVYEKQGVSQAFNVLSNELNRMGAHVYGIFLDSVEQEDEKENLKCGLDDYIVSCGEKADDKLLELMDTALPISLIDQLFRMNDEYALYKGGEFFVTLQGEEITRLKPTSLKNLLLPHNILVREIKDGKIKATSKNIFEVWKHWPLRRYIHNEVYEPGVNRFTRDENGNEILNSWPGWGCEAKKGDVSMFLKFLDHLFVDTDESIKNWFLQWLAYPIQNPGFKLLQSVIFYSNTQGNGKTLLGMLMKRIYGKNYVTVNNLNLDSQFNEWQAEKQFCMIDEMPVTGKRKYTDTLKRMVTQDTILVNKKFERTREIRDCLNYYITTNNSDVIYIDSNDRRFFIHEVLAPYLPAEEAQKYIDWMDNGGSEAVLYFLQNEVDCSSFNPKSKAPETIVKSEMVDETTFDVENVIRDMVNNPEKTITINGVQYSCDIITPSKFLAMYDPEKREKVTIGNVRKYFKKYGFKKLFRSDRYFWGSELLHLYCFRNFDEWEKADIEKVKTHVFGSATRHKMSDTKKKYA